VADLGLRARQPLVWFARGKSREVSVPGAGPSHQPHDSMSLPEKTHLLGNFGLSAPFQQNLPGRAAFAEFQRTLQAGAEKKIIRWKKFC